MKKKITASLFWFLPLLLMAQPDSIYLSNPSFEDFPRKGDAYSPPIRGWFDCGGILFPKETPPDIHPMDFWSVNLPATDGNTYLGMVVRDIDSWESVSQRLSSPLESGKCYSFSINMARSKYYISGSQLTNESANYTHPVVLRIWGGSGFCNKKELIAESEPVENEEWYNYTFEFEPRGSHRFIVFEAFYKTPVLFPYNGHVLLDGASAIVQIPCAGEEPFLVTAPPPPPSKYKTIKNKKIDSSPGDSSPTKSTDVDMAQNIPKKKNKFLVELDRTQLVKGQKIKVENLYFEADTSTISESSYPVLDELFHFLNDNNDIVVEIGGHTNGNRGISHEYCDRLSTDRAKEVAGYLARKGISPQRLKYKGYGKRKPVATNMTDEGRLKNQRVEIKILSIEHLK